MVMVGWLSIGWLRIGWLRIGWQLVGQPDHAAISDEPLAISRREASAFDSDGQRLRQAKRQRRAFAEPHFFPALIQHDRRARAAGRRAADDRALLAAEQAADD